MIYTTYISNLKNLPENAAIVRVCRPNLLSPSKELLARYKSGKMTWVLYTAHYKAELADNPKAFNFLYQLKQLAETKDVFIYCYEKDPEFCHRSILLQILKDAGAKVGGEYRRDK